MGGKVGGLSHKFYRETAGIKVSAGQKVKAGAILTREGDRWKPGVNVLGQIKLSAACAGEIYFSRKRNKFKKVVTVVNVRAVGDKTVQATKAEVKVKAKARMAKKA